MESPLLEDASFLLRQLDVAGHSENVSVDKFFSRCPLPGAASLRRIPVARRCTYHDGLREGARDGEVPIAEILDGFAIDWYSWRRSVFPASIKKVAGRLGEASLNRELVQFLGEVYLAILVPKKRVAHFPGNAVANLTRFRTIPTVEGAWGLGCGSAAPPQNVPCQSPQTSGRSGFNGKHVRGTDIS